MSLSFDHFLLLSKGAIWSAIGKAVGLMAQEGGPAEVPADSSAHQHSPGVPPPEAAAAGVENPRYEGFLVF